MSCTVLQAQVNLKDSVMRLSLVQFSYAGQLPGGDLAKRFGFNSNIALSYSFKSKKNLLLGLDFTYLFGRSIRESGILDSISTKSGHYLIDINGELADVRFYERGFSTTIWFGKLFPLSKKNVNSGLVTNIGLGFLEHHIKIEDIGNKSPQLTGDLRKGYDRLTNGPAVSEYIGYTYLSNSRYVNFFFGLELMQAFTQNRRAWDYDLMAQDTKQRIDLLYSLRVGWILPLYKREPKAFYYN
jgi:hypothetical protein